MDSILKHLFRQSERIFHLTEITLSTFQLQYNLARNHVDLFDRNNKTQCVFSINLYDELQSMENSLKSTCFPLQQAIYRLQVLRNRRVNSPIQIDHNIIIESRENLIHQSKSIQTLIESIKNECTLENVSLNLLEELFQQTHENFQIFFNYIYTTATLRSTIFLLNLVSNTFDKFYFIFDFLVRVNSEIEKMKIK